MDLIPSVALDALTSEDPRKRAAALVILCFLALALSLRFWAWRLRARDQKIWNEMIMSSPDLTPAEKLQQVKSNPPPPVPPGLHTLGVLLLSASLAAGAVTVSAAPRSVIAGPVTRRCDPPCKAPQRCENGVCTDAAAEPDRPPQRPPPPEQPPKRRKNERHSPSQVATTLPGWFDTSPAASPFDTPAS